jgi:hypothetical protein
MKELSKRLTPSNPLRIVYRRRSHLIGGLVMAAITALVFIGLMIEAQRVSGFALATAFLVIDVPINIRFALARMVTSSDGVFVANVFSNRSLRWDEIERFEIGRWTIFPYVCLIRLRNGRTTHAFGIQERTNFPDGSGESMADEMNTELRERQAAPDSAAPRGVAG